MVVTWVTAPGAGCVVDVGDLRLPTVAFLRPSLSGVLLDPFRPPACLPAGNGKCGRGGVSGLPGSWYVGEVVWGEVSVPYG